MEFECWPHVSWKLFASVLFGSCSHRALWTPPMLVNMQPKIGEDLCRLLELLLSIPYSSLLCPADFSWLSLHEPQSLLSLSPPLPVLSSKNYLLADSVGSWRSQLLVPPPQLVCYLTLPVVPVSENLFVTYLSSFLLFGGRAIPYKYSFITGSGNLFLLPYCIG